MLRFLLTVRDLVFFYGTLMAGFDRRRRAGMDAKLKYLGRGSIRAALFDLGLYPAAVPAPDGVVWGELYEMRRRAHGAGRPRRDRRLPARRSRPQPVRALPVDVALPDGTSDSAWVYFYNAPLGGAKRIPSGDYLEHVKVR